MNTVLVLLTGITLVELSYIPDLQTAFSTYWYCLAVAVVADL